MRYHKIPNETVRRLPIYLRGILFFSEQNREQISSQELADFVGINSSQIRKDFSYFGDFGTPGVGYNIERLSRQVRKILKLDTVHKTALVGVGNLGSAVLAYPGFKKYRFEIVAAFDADENKVGRKVRGVEVEDLSSLGSLKERGIKLGIIAVPEVAAQETADALVAADVTGILNFSPCYISVPRKVKIISIDIAMDLARLPYYMPSRVGIK